MKDLKYISDNYSKMSDGQLLNLWNEKYKLRSEIVPILKLELEKRKIEFEETIDAPEQSVDKTYSDLNLISHSLKLH